MKVVFWMIVFVTVMFCENIHAFDGKRKGYVLGGGLGVAANAGWEVDNSNFTDDNSGVAIQLLQGYAWDESNMLVVEGNFAAYKSELVNTFLNFIGVEDKTISQGFIGPSWYHYFGSVGNSLFSAVGLGLYAFGVEDADANDPGVGFMFGGGYEFARHVQIGVYGAAGQTSVGIFDLKHAHVNVVLSAIAF